LASVRAKAEPTWPAPIMPILMVVLLVYLAGRASEKFALSLSAAALEFISGRYSLVSTQ
jgi:hypothetical protein